MAPQNRAKQTSRFKPGVSGNPGGRPKSREANEMIRAFFDAEGEAVIIKLFKMAKGKDGRLALSAIREILDRKLGKAAQALDIHQEMVPETDEGTASWLAFVKLPENKDILKRYLAALREEERAVPPGVPS